MGKDLVTFLKSVEVRAGVCQWEDLLIVGGANLLKNHSDVDVDDVITARKIRNATKPTTIAEAQPIIKAKMMFHFILDSLGPIARKKINTRLDEIEGDGPTLLKFILQETFQATPAASYNIRERLFTLDPKNFKHNIQHLHTW